MYNNVLAWLLLCSFLLSGGLETSQEQQGTGLSIGLPMTQLRQVSVCVTVGRCPGLSLFGTGRPMDRGCMGGH